MSSTLLNISKFRDLCTRNIWGLWPNRGFWSFALFRALYLLHGVGIELQSPMKSEAKISKGSPLPICVTVSLVLSRPVQITSVLPQQGPQLSLPWFLLGETWTWLRPGPCGTFAFLLGLQSETISPGLWLRWRMSNYLSSLQMYLIWYR